MAIIRWKIKDKHEKKKVQSFPFLLSFPNMGVILYCSVRLLETAVIPGYYFIQVMINRFMQTRLLARVVILPGRIGSMVTWHPLDSENC